MIYIINQIGREFESKVDYSLPTKLVERKKKKIFMTGGSINLKHDFTLYITTSLICYIKLSQHFFNHILYMIMYNYDCNHEMQHAFGFSSLKS